MSTNSFSVEMLLSDDTGVQRKIPLNLFLCADGNWRGAEEIAGNRTIQVIVAPFTGGTPTPKQKSDQLHTLRTTISRTTP